MKKIQYILLVAISILLATASFAQKEFTIKGTMRYSTIEGGCWYLEAHKKNYQLTGTEEQLATCRVEGRPLMLTVRQRNMQTVCMMGEVVEILDIIDTVFHPHNPPVERLKITGKVYMLEDGCYYVKTKKGNKYEFQGDLPKKYRKAGAKYSVTSMVIPSVDGFHNMAGVIMLPTLSEPATRNVPKKADPR